MDWRDIFIRYVEIVIREEGVDFLYPHHWSAEEWEAIREAVGD